MSVLSIVIPVFNEEDTLPELFNRLDQVFSASSLDMDVEVLMVDDGSTDKSTDLIRSRVLADGRYRLVSLSRNFGHQSALLAGLNLSVGAAVVVMDADLQDPPEVILDLVMEWRKGADVVFAQRKSRNGESSFKRLTAASFYRLIDVLSDTQLPRNVGDFRLVDRRVADIVNSMTEKSLYLRGLVSWVGFKQSTVLFDRDPRFAGSTKYSLKRMLDLASDGLVSFSERPLRLVTRLGLLVTFCSFLTVVFFIATSPFAFGPRAPGWLSVILAVLVLGGVQLVCLGIVGEYISKIYRESKNRPIYLIDEKKSQNL